MRFGLIGTGIWAEQCHAAGLAAHPEVEFTGIWGRDRSKANALAQRYSTRAEPDLDALFAKVEAVAIAVPPDVQPELACRAAAAGCHLLLEKPLSLSAAEAGRVVEDVARAGVSSVVLFTFRFQEPTATWLSEQVLGTPWQGGNITLLRPPSGNAFVESAWRQKHGALWDMMPHALAVLLGVLGPVERVSAQHGLTGALQLMLVHRGGALSSVTLDMSLPPECVRFDVSFWGRGGFVIHPPGLPVSSPTQLMTSALSALLTSIRSGVPHNCDAHFAAGIVDVLADCERSLSSGAEHARDV